MYGPLWKGQLNSMPPVVLVQGFIVVVYNFIVAEHLAYRDSLSWFDHWDYTNHRDLADTGSSLLSSQ